MRGCSVWLYALCVCCFDVNLIYIIIIIIIKVSATIVTDGIKSYFDTYRLLRHRRRWRLSAATYNNGEQ